MNGENNETFQKTNPNPIPLAQFYECSVLSKTPLFTEQKHTCHTYWEAMLQGRGWRHRRPI